MRINYLELRNYRKFENVRLELPDGIIGILGNNGTGKSTLVESIGWALFGNQKEIVRVGKGSIRRSGASDREPTLVKTEFNFGGDEYIVSREMSGKSLSIDAKLLVNRKLVANGAIEVTRFIEKKFGMDYKSFFISVFARQKELNALSSLTERERKITIVRMLGIDRLDDVIDEIGKSERELRSRVSGLREMLVDETGKPRRDILSQKRLAYEKDVERLSSEIAKLTEDKNKYAERENQLDQRGKEISEKLSKLRDAESRLKIYKDNLESKEAELKQLEIDLEEARKAEQEIAHLGDLNDKLEALRIEKEKLISLESENEKLVSIREDLDAIEEELKIQESIISTNEKICAEESALMERIEESNIKLDEAEKELRTFRDSFSRMKEQYIHLKDALESNEHQHSQISELGPESECPTCERTLGEHFEKLIEKLSKKIADDRKGIEELDSSLRETERNIVDREKRVEALIKRRENLQKKEKNFIKAKENLDNAIQIKNKLQKKKLKLTAEARAIQIDGFDRDKMNETISMIGELEQKRDYLLGKAAVAKRIPEVEAAKAIVIDEIDKIGENIRRNSVDAAEIELVQKSSRDVEDDKREIKRLSQELFEKIIALTKQEESANSGMNSIDRELESLAETDEKASRYEAELSSLTKLSELMKKFRKELLSRIIPTLSDTASDLLERLTNGKYSSLDLDEGYNIFLEDGGVEYRLERFSGGEIDLANLCLRLAISKVISERAGSEGLNILVLDEIFGSQDSVRKRSLLIAFNALSKQFRQIFLITHIDDIKDSLSGMIEVFEDRNGVSHARLIP